MTENTVVAEHTVGKQHGEIVPGSLTSRRPSERDAFVRARALEMFFPRIEDWLIANGRVDDGSDVARKDIESVMFDGVDGYALTRKLEDGHGWTGNADLVYVMAEAETTINASVRELTRQWVQNYKIKSPFGIGDTVRVNDSESSHNNIEGVVVALNEEEAQCGLRLPVAGNNSLCIFNFEDLALVHAGAAAQPTG